MVVKACRKTEQHSDQGSKNRRNESTILFEDMPPLTKRPPTRAFHHFPVVPAWEPSLQQICGPLGNIHILNCGTNGLNYAVKQQNLN
jgi:hypothetical protein